VFTIRLHPAADAEAALPLAARLALMLGLRFTGCAE
jgi:hypothetical protein